MSSGTDKIVSNIISGAQSKVDVIISEAEAEVQSIKDNGNREAELSKQRILNDGEKQSKMRYQQIVSEAKMNSRRAQLRAREDVIEEAFNKATEELEDIASSSSDVYKKSLIEIITEAALEIGGGDLIIQLKSEDEDKIKGNLNEIESDVESKIGVKTTLEIGEPIKTIGGAILKTKNGEIEVNNTIESRMLRFRKDLRSKVAKILFN